MEFTLGTEPLEEYLSFERAAAAHKLVKDVLLVRPGEHVAITGDTSSDRRVVEATAGAVCTIGAVPVVVWYPTQVGSGVEPPRPVAGAIADCDVWIEFAVGYTLYSNAYRRAIERGVRYICLTGMDVEMMVRTLGRVDYPKLLTLGEKLRALVGAARIVHVTTPAGTDLVADNGGRYVRHSGKLADTPGEPVMLGGQISWCPLEETINGRLVFDGAVWPPAELGVLRSPVALTVEEGVIRRIEGGVEARTFERWLSSFNDPNMYRVAHYSLGFNPGVTRPTGRIVEDERIFGCLNVGIGTQGPQMRAKGWKAAAHTDGISLNPTILLDGEPLEVEGKYVHPDIVTACRDLGVPGY